MSCGKWMEGDRKQNGKGGSVVQLFQWRTGEMILQTDTSSWFVNLSEPLRQVARIETFR